MKPAWKKNGDLSGHVYSLVTDNRFSVERLPCRINHP